jgi:GH15 family glucan-1,4-alpha-glucosidase
VRVGNEAHDQFQLGAIGNVLHCFAFAARAGVSFTRDQLDMLAPLIEYLETHWRKPGSGIWETRASQRQYVDSKLMAWVAARALEESGWDTFATVTPSG